MYGATIKVISSFYVHTLINDHFSSMKMIVLSSVFSWVCCLELPLLLFCYFNVKLGVPVFGICERGLRKGLSIQETFVKVKIIQTELGFFFIDMLHFCKHYNYVYIINALCQSILLFPAKYMVREPAQNTIDLYGTWNKCCSYAVCMSGIKMKFIRLELGATFGGLLFYSDRVRCILTFSKFQITTILNYISIYMLV